MSATGKNTNDASTPSFIAALVVAGITVGALSAVWLVLHSRKHLSKVFQPRHELAPEAKRPTPLPSGLFAFWKTVFSTPDTEIIVANGPDAYFFVRFLKVFGVQMLVPYFLLTFVICVPISVASPNAGKDGLNKLAFGNVALDQQNRHIGHFLVALILMLYTLYLLWREYKHFIEVRQAWLSSEQHMTLARARTIMITGLPSDYNSESAIKELAGKVASQAGPVQRSAAPGASHNELAPRASNVTAVGAPPDKKAGFQPAPETPGLVMPPGSGLQMGNLHRDNGEGPTDAAPGGIRQIWMAQKVKDLEKVWQERDDECSRLEGGVAKLVKLANKNDLKGKTPDKQGQYDAERVGAAGSHPDRYVLPKKRPTWKQGLLGLIGTKMTLESSPEYIATHNKELEGLRAQDWPQGNTAFIRFDSQAEAFNFAKLAPRTDKKLRMAVHTGIEVIPEDIQWSNVGMNPYQRKVRTAISWALTIGLIIIWAIPVGFVGLVSNVNQLCIDAPWLAWLCTIPPAVLGIIQGILPPVLLAVLFMLLPIVLRLWVKMQGEVRKSDIELKVFSRYWLFQVIHGFLIITAASGLISALSTIGDTASSIPTLLAAKLPDASIFFLTFVLTTTFSAAAKSYSRVVPVVMFFLKGILGGNTPRKVFMTEYKMAAINWATTWPPMCLLVCITIVYSVIQPVITLLSLVAMVMLYAAWKYTLYWCADQPDYLETGGLFYVKALRTVFVSLYLEGICLAGLFFLSTNQNGERAKAGLACGAIMVVVIIIIAVAQAYIDWVEYKPPAILFASSKSMPYNPIAGSASTVPEEEEEAAGAQLGNTSGFHARAFDHPALWKKQPCVWITNDPLGVGRFECERIQAAGVEASTAFAGMDEKRNVVVGRGPPDEAWYGGFTQ